MSTEPGLAVTCCDGHIMPVYTWLPPGNITAVVIIAHGLAEHGGRYARFAKKLNEQGIAVYADDHRGHGKAVDDREQLGITHDDWVNSQLDDFHVLLGLLRKKHGQVPFFLMGHSMGSFLAQRFVQLYEHEIDGLILSGTNGHKDPLLPFGTGMCNLLMRLFGRDFRSKMLYALTFGKFNDGFKPARTPFDWLSRDPAEVDAYIADPLCGFNASVQLVYYLFLCLDEIFEDQAIRLIRKDLPVYVFGGDQDPVGLQGKGFMKLVENWRSAGITNIEYRLYENGRHEMLNEINRDEVMDDCINWLIKQIPLRKSS